MRRLGLLLALLALGLGTAAQELTAEQLIARVEAAQRTSGIRTRAKLTKTARPAKTEEVMQVVIKGRREGEATEMLYQLLWPKEVAGRALVVGTSADGTVGGFLFEPPDKKIPLTPRLMAQPVFGTDVTVEDLAEAYWRWPLQKLSGEERALGRVCRVVESRPGPGTATSYSLVRSWIAPDIALPLVVEKFGKDGKLAKRFLAAKVIKQGPGSWGAAIMVVDTADGRSRTTLEGTKSDRDIEIPAEQFTLEGLKRNLPASQASPPLR